MSWTAWGRASYWSRASFAVTLALPAAVRHAYEFAAVSVFLNTDIRSLDLLWSYTLMRFGPFVPNSDGMRWNHHSAAIAQITLSSVKFSLSFDDDYLPDLWNRPLLQSSAGLFASTKCSCFRKNTLARSSCGSISHLCILLIFHKLLEANRRHTLKLDSDVCDSEIRDDFIGPNWSRKWRSCWINFRNVSAPVV
jgi:hypothetical protein